MKENKKTVEITKVMRYQIVKPLDCDWKLFGKILRAIQKETMFLLNKSTELAWEYFNFSAEYKKKTGSYPDIKTEGILGFGKRGNKFNSSLSNYCNACLTDKDTTKMNSGNAMTTIKKATDIWKPSNDSKKKINKILNGEERIPFYKNDSPINVESKNIKIIKEDVKYYVNLSLISNQYKAQLERTSGQFLTLLKVGDASQKSVIDKIIDGEYKINASQILFSKDKWFLNLNYTFEKEINKPLDKNRVLGVDLGIVNTAAMQIYDYNTNTYDWLKWNQCVLSGEELIKFQQRQYSRHKSMQKQIKTAGEGRCGHGKKTKMKPFEKSSGKISNFKDTFNHKYSKYIVEFAVRNNCGIIQMEDLTGYKNDENILLKNWSYYKLQQKVEYKAAQYGIKVEFINPAYTSKRCSECGSIHIENRDCKKDQARFSCVACGYGSDGKVNADINAARNIALLNIEDLIEEECIKKGLKYKKKKDDDSKVA